MKRNKLTALFLSAALTVTMLAGCGQSKSTDNKVSTSQDTGSQTASTAADSESAVSSEETEPASEGIVFPLEETQKFSMFAVIAGAEYALEDNVSFQKLCEDTNIQFDIQSVLNADKKEKKNLSLASGEYPDVFFKAGFSATELSKYGNQGILIPLQDLIREYAPNLTKLLDERDAWKYLEDRNGNIYSLPEVDRQDPGITVYWMNQKWMDNLGLSEPKSLDELYEVLKAFKEKDANGNGDPDDEIPITANTTLSVNLLLPYFGINYDTGTKTALNEDGLFYVPTSDVYKDFLEFSARLYAEGILDKKAFTQGYEQQGAVGQSGDIYGSFWDSGAFLTVGRDNDDDYIALTPFTEGTYPITSGISVGALCITDACEHPELIVAWADQLYSEEGGILAWLGVEGETYRINDDGTWTWITDGSHGDNTSVVRASSTLQGTNYHPSVQPQLWYTGMSAEVDAEEVYLNEQREKLNSISADPRPPMSYSDEDSKERATLKTDLDNYISQYTAKVITGELNLEDSWEEYIATMNQMGAERLEEIYQNTYNKAMEK